MRTEGDEPCGALLNDFDRDGLHSRYQRNMLDISLMHILICENFG